jgi:hypothetical protein
MLAAAGRGFATPGNDQQVVMFDLTTFNVLGRIPVDEAQETSSRQNADATLTVSQQDGPDA